MNTQNMANEIRNQRSYAAYSVTERTYAYMQMCLYVHLMWIFVQ